MITPLLQNTTSCALETTTLPEALEAAARDGAFLWIAVKDSEAIECPLRDVLERASRLARHLVGQGLAPGERVALMLPTGEAWLTAFFGTLLAGGVAVPIASNLSFGGMDRYSETVRAVFKAAGARFLLGDAAIEPHAGALGGPDSPLEFFVRADAIDGSQGSAAPLPTPAPDDLAVIQYTSGTTGAPKGVMLSHRALLSNVQMIGDRVGMSPRDVGVSWLPLFHDMGLVGALLTALYWRYPLLLMPVESFLLQPRRWLQWMSRKRATLSVAPNFAYQFVIDRVAERHLSALDLSAWRCAFNGAEPVRPSTLRAFAERFGPLGFSARAFQPVYGMAENALAATFPSAGDHWQTTRFEARELVSVGTPLAGVSVAIIDEHGNALAPGEAGSILLKSPSLMQGYFRNEAASAAVLRDGWLHTGDIGLVRDGALFVTGRSKELIIKRGRNYVPDELEGVAVRAGKGRIVRAAAFGMTDEREGTERLVLVLETRPVNGPERERLKRDVEAALIAATGVGADATLVVPPRTIERTTSGKLRRADLRTRYLEGRLREMNEDAAPTSAASSAGVEP